MVACHSHKTYTPRVCSEVCPTELPDPCLHKERDILATHMRSVSSNKLYKLTLTLPACSSSTFENAVASLPWKMDLPLVSFTPTRALKPF